MKLVEITWKDHSAFSLCHWRDEHELQELEPMTVKTVGFVVVNAKGHITVAATHNAKHGRFSGEMCIDKRCIEKIRNLR